MAAKILAPKRVGAVKTFLRAQYHTKIINADLEAEYEYTDVPQYPPIHDTTYKGTKLRRRRQWYDHIRNLPTVDQKLNEIAFVAKPEVEQEYRDMAEKGRQFFTYIATPNSRYYNSLPAFQYATRTHLIDGLPERFAKLDVDDAYARIKPYLVEAIASELEIDRTSWLPEYKDGEGIRQNYIITQVLSVLFKGLGNEVPHLETSQVDLSPRCDSFWWHGRYHPDMRGRNKGKKFVTIPFQYQGKPDAQIRVVEPLPPVVDMDDPLVQSREVTDFPFHPSNFGWLHKNKILTSLPGTWPLHGCSFPLVSFHQRASLINDKSPFKTAEEVNDAVNASAIIAGFGWLNGVASQLGFSPFHDPTYPLVSQVVSTDGQHWTFAVYQLNTVSLHPDFYEDNTARNLCWSSGNLRLFEAFENGELKGLDDEVLKTLLRFVLQQPKAPEGLELRPYLGEDMRSEEERKAKMQEWMKIYDCRFILREALQREVPLWVKIYKRHPDAPYSICKLK
ncbi:unnamed protein product [Ixodes pacificus]